MKNLIKKTSDKLALITAISVAVMSTAHAALSTEEQAVLDSITAKITDYTAPAFVVLAAMIGLFFGIKMLKKVFNKVT